MFYFTVALAGLVIGKFIIRTTHLAVFGDFMLDYSFSRGWVICFALTSAVCLYYLISYFWPKFLVIYPMKGYFRRARKLFALTLFILMINAFFVFGVAPWAAHQVIAEHGYVLTRVIEKSSYGGRYACTPRLRISELDEAWFCPTFAFYRVIKPGHWVALEGRVSQFGMSVEHYAWTSPPPRI